MIRIIAFVFCCLTGMLLFAQEESEYFLGYGPDNQLYIFHGVRYKVDQPQEDCLQYFPENDYSISKISEGEFFLIFKILDEESGNSSGVIILDKKGNQINYEKVYQARSKHFSYPCCVYVQELNGKLYFYDWEGPEGEDYDCSLDSQTSWNEYFSIPRYYIFDVEANRVETIILNNQCPKLIENGKVICH